jgi:hypothetical protein
MAIYHLSIKLLSRSQGRSATAACAYRAGARILDSRQGMAFDYRRKRHVGYTKIHVPKNSPSWATDRQELWNRVELGEKRKDAQLARLFTLALPHELTDQEHVVLLERFIRRCFTRHGMIVDAAIHTDAHNKHAHLMVTLRHVSAEGFGAKNREWNSQEQIEFWRASWSRQTNVFLMARGHKARIDHRSLKVQAATSTPQKQERKIMATTSKPNPVSTLTGSLPQRVTRVPLNSEVNFITSTPHPIPQEHFPRLFRYFEELLGLWFPGQTTSVVEDRTKNSYALQVDGVTLLTVERDKIKLATGSAREIEVAIQACIDFGWKRIRLHGSDDFKQRAYAEAIKKGYRPEDIDGLSEPQPSLSPTDNSGAKTAYRPHRSPIRRRTV